MGKLNATPDHISTSESTCHHSEKSQHRPLSKQPFPAGVSASPVRAYLTPNPKQSLG